MGTRIRFNQAAIKKLLKAEAVREDVHRRAKAIADAAGGEEKGYEAQSSIGLNRARAAAITTTTEAIVDNARNQSLLRNIDAGR